MRRLFGFVLIGCIFLFFSGELVGAAGYIDVHAHLDPGGLGRGDSSAKKGSSRQRRGQKKGDIDKEVEQSKKAMALMGGRLRGMNKVNLKEFDDNRLLVIIDKKEKTPVKYPRGPGIPKRRPIIS